MTQTIPGGAYQSPDGTWHDANGKALPSSKRQQFEQLQAERQAERQAAQVPVPAAPAPAAPTVTTETGMQVEPADEAPAPKRRSRKSE